jgi:type II pantothenate kinase
MKYSVDFGGSTIDVISWKGKNIYSKRSYERHPRFSSAGISDFFAENRGDFADASRFFITGGRVRRAPAKILGVPVVKVPEIQAIARGGLHLLKTLLRSRSRGKPSRRPALKKVLVVSMGTGTCLVTIENRPGNGSRKEKLFFRHVGGTGVGGGTFLGLASALLNQKDPAKLLKMFERGKTSKVDVSVKDIVGSGIGIVPGTATASNLAKLSREISFSKDDLAAGIVNLVGQTIGILAVFAAKAYGCDAILLTGKLTRVQKILSAVKEAGRLYKVVMLVPKDAAYVSALGAFDFQS